MVCAQIGLGLMQKDVKEMMTELGLDSILYCIGAVIVRLCREYFLAVD